MDYKYCEDCRFYTSAMTFDLCVNTKANRWAANLVKREMYPDAAMERLVGNCGEEGKNFEPKE